MTKSDELKDLMRSACASFEAAGVAGTEGARAMREGLNRIEELEAKLAKAVEAFEGQVERTWTNASVAPQNREKPMTNDPDPWSKLLSSIPSVTFAALAIFSDHSVEYLLAAILVYQWGRG